MDEAGLAVNLMPMSALGLNSLEALCRPGAVIMVSGDVMQIHRLPHRTGDCKHCGAPLEKAQSASCWYCQRPI